MNIYIRIFNFCVKPIIVFMLVGLLNVAMAGDSTSVPSGFSNMAKPPQPKKTNGSEHLVVGSRFYRYPHSYFSIGVGGYHLNAPEVLVGNINAATTPIASIDNDGFTSRFNFAFGYAFYNPRSKIFGPFSDVVFKLSFFDKKDTKNRGALGANGNIWYIDGSGRFGTGYAIGGYSFSAKHRLIDTGLYYRGIASFASTCKFLTHPRIGLVWSGLNSKYNYLLNYDLGGFASTDAEEYRTKTNYYGIALGDQLDLRVAPRALLYGDVELQLLHANSKLNATQFADNLTPGEPIINVKVSSSKSVTYRAIVSVGAKYIILPRANSVTLDLKAGVDRFGYNPRVVTPSTRNNGRRIHLEGTAQNNLFATLDLTVPLG